MNDCCKAAVAAALEQAAKLSKPMLYAVENSSGSWHERTKRLREALEFYARINSASEARRIWVQDGGACARAALAESEGQ